MEVADILAELVRINSVNPEWGGPGEAGVAAWLKDFFTREGIEFWETEVLPGRCNVVARIPGRDPERRIVFEAHMDTVVAEGMDISPFEPEIRDGRLFGRGAVDVKAGLAAMVHAMTRIEEPPCEVWLACVVDEEHAYRGVLGLIEELPGAGAAVVAEPTENRIVRANKGVLRWAMATRGILAHSSKPHLGKNAIYEMARVLQRLEEDDARLAENRHLLVGPATCSVGIIEGGTQINIVPDFCRIELDRRLLPGEKAEQVLSDYVDLMKGLDVEMEPPELVDEAMETPEDAAVVRVAKKVLGEMGGEPMPVGVPFGCDVTKLSRAGVPGIIFGPGSIDQAHAAVEFVELEQVRFAAEFYEKFAMTFEG